MRSLIGLVILLLVCQFAYAATLSYHVTGIDGPVLDNVLNRLQVVEQSLGEPLTEEDITRFYRNAPQNIAKAMEPFGHFEPEISSQLQLIRNQWVATFTVQAGPVIPITSIDVQVDGPGQYATKIVNFLTNFPLKIGDPFTTTQYEQAKRQFFTIADNSGYLDASLVTREVIINRNQYTAHIILHFTTGPQYYFGEVYFVDAPLRDDFLQRYVKFQPGEPYSTRAVIELQDDLSHSGYFQRVTINPEIDQARNRHIPIQVHMSPTSSQVYTFGVGYSTDVQLRGTAGVNLNRVTDTGHNFNAFLQASSVESTLQAQYLIPGQDPTTEHFSIAASIFDLDYDNLISGNHATSRAARLTGGYIKQLDGWQQILAMNLLYEQFTITPNPKARAFIPYPSASWRRVTTDDLFFPSKGYSINVNVLGSSDIIGSDVNFAQVEVDGKYIHSITDLTRVLLRGTLGYTAISDINTLPPSLQFYTGGIQSVRGYQYQALGPGKYLVIGSVELQQKIFGKWYIAPFYDAGNAFNSGEDVLKHSWGINVIRETLVGPVRLGFAQALSLDRKPFRFIFSIGPDF